MDKERMRIAVQYIFKKGAWPIVANSSENERVASRLKETEGTSASVPARCDYSRHNQQRMRMSVTARGAPSYPFAAASENERPCTAVMIPGITSSE